MALEERGPGGVDCIGGRVVIGILRRFWSKSVKKIIWGGILLVFFGDEARLADVEWRLILMMQVFVKLKVVNRFGVDVSRGMESGWREH
jgi:hypothetical protein